MDQQRGFPDDFVWGAATASYQIEGAHAEDGRKPSVWDTLCREPGRIARDHHGEVACDHYHRFREDVGLMRDLGLRAYRFSVSWSRVMPEGEGAVNEKGLDFYRRLVDTLLEAGIAPYVTLFHWDLPQALEDQYGGWRGRETAYRFSEYARIMGRALGDRVKRWFTINEFLCFTDLGYGGEGFAPGLKVEAKVLNQVRHHGLLAHGLGLGALRAVCPADCALGLAENVSTTVPVFETPEHIAAAKRAYLEKYSFFLRTVMEGQYPGNHLEGPDAPEVEAGDLAAIGAPVDVVGLNCYSPVRVRAVDQAPGWEALRDPEGGHAANSPWHLPGPEVLYWGPRWLKEIWGVKHIVISENGTWTREDALDRKGEVLDVRRIGFLRAHLQAAQRAVAEGYPLKGYFVWSLMDNFEWTQGYEKRFGLYYVRYTDQARIAKLSAEYYREVIRANRAL